MNDTLPLNSFLEEAKKGIIIDVRTPAEFEAGHIPGAVNLPLFSNEERAEVGTLYVQVSREKAFERGLEFVGPKMAGFVRTARKIADGKPLLIYCWRGGMRSNSMAWLMRSAKLEAATLIGGYKAWRAGFSELLSENKWKFIVLGGYTGCGKTELLCELSSRGEQVIDLEGLANHKGSAFGHIGENKQPSTEHFGNLLHNTLRQFSPCKSVWLEGESPSIGRVFITDDFLKPMSASPFINYSIPTECRLERLKNMYGTASKEVLIASFEKIRGRLGGQNANEAISLLENGDIKGAAAIALVYYDKTYNHCFKSYPDKRKVILLEMDEDNIAKAADKLLILEKEI